MLACGVGPLGSSVKQEPAGVSDKSLLVGCVKQSRNPLSLGRGGCQ